MGNFLLFLLAIGVFSCRALENDTGKIWALLTAGSNGWENYRHQADVSHAYHILLNHGISEENIIVMMYDDIANNPENPRPGKIYNVPGGKDVYAGVKIDYKGDDVTPENFLAVLKGDEAGIKGGNGRVIKSNENDKIFVYFTDHGAPGTMVFPNDVLTVKSLNDALKSMHEQKKYKELTFYLETCYSGSMFENVLPENINIYAVAAAKPDEESSAAYCQPWEDFSWNCFTDEFSINWMQNSERANLNSETLQKQFEIVKELTTDSTVMHYGDLNIAKELVSEFQGHKDANQSMTRSQASIPHDSIWPTYEVPILLLRRKLESENDEKIQRDLTSQIRSMEEKRQYLKEFMENLVEKLVEDENARQKLVTEHPGKLTNLECHHEVMHAFNRGCMKFNKNPYALKYSYILANLCEFGLQTDEILVNLQEHCSKIKFQEIV